MSGHSEEEIKKSVKVYISVFVILMVLTILTVAVSYLHVPVMLGVLIALLIATVKGSLVAIFFMHLKQETRFIFLCLLLAFVLLIVMFGLPFWMYTTSFAGNV